MKVTEGEHAAGLKLDLGYQAGLQIGYLKHACMLYVGCAQDVQG